MSIQSAGYVAVRFKGNDRPETQKNKLKTTSQVEKTTPLVGPSLDLVDLVLSTDTNVNLLCDAVEKIGEQSEPEQRRDAFLWLKTLLKRANANDLNREGDTGERPLDVADRIKDLPALRFLFQHGARQMSDQDRPNQLLWKAPCWNRYEDWQKVIQLKGFHPNKQDKNGRTAFMNAAIYGANDLTERLLTFDDIDINLKDKNGFTALHEATLQCEGRRWGQYPDGNQQERVALIKNLLKQKNIDLNAQEAQGGRTAIMFPAKKGNLEIVKLLAEQPGIDLDVETEDGKTAFTEAHENGHLAIWKALWQAKHPEEEAWVMDLYMPFDLPRRDRRNETIIY